MADEELKISKHSLSGSLIVKAAVIFLIALFIECFIYNFRHWESLFFKEIDQYTLSFSGIEDIDGYFYRVTDPGSAYLEISDINAPVKNIFFDPFGDNPDQFESYKIHLSVTDAGNALYKDLPETEVVNGILESCYIRVFLVGSSSRIRINLSVREGTKFGFSGLGLNQTRPFIFHPWRFSIFLLILTFLWVFRPGSGIYSIRTDLHDRKQLAAVIIAILVNLIMVTAILFIFRIRNWKNDSLTRLQYNYLAESLLQGHTYLDFEPPAALSTMENPYDTALRNKVLSEAGESAVLDFAWFNGRYYSYFGIVPELLFYLPYRIITGEFLETAMVILTCGILFVFTVFWFVHTLIKKYFQNTSLGAFLLMCTVFIAGSEITYALQVSTLYSVPIITALLFDLAGITCWIHAAEQDGEIKRKWLTAGAVCIALVIGCRPQLAIAVLLGFPIFWKQLREGRFFSRKGIPDIFCLAAPFLIIGTGLMFYNFIRFQNPFNFGAVYNLTGFDMTHRGFIPGRMILSFFEELFQPIRVNAKFPYFSISEAHQKLASDFQGIMPNEILFGGFFAFNAVSLILFNLRSFKTGLRKKGLWGFSLLTVLFALIIITMDAQVACLTQRYLMDFSFFLMIPTVIILLLMLEDRANPEKYALTLKMIVLLSFLCIAVNYLTLIGAGKSNSLPNHPEFYYRAKYQLFSILSIR